MSFIEDFFKNLVRYKAESVKQEVKSKAKSYQAQAQSKVAAKANKVMDAPINKVRGKMTDAEKKARGAVQGDKKGDDKSGQAKAPAGGNKGGAPAAPQVKGENVGWFSKKEKKPAQAPARGAVQEDFDPGMKTQAIDISGLVDERAQDVVGWVVALNGVLRGKDFRLVTGKNVMGTAADCDIVLTDPYLSAKHSVIRHEEGRFTVIDLDSTNGTFVNERRISKTELIDNDKIRIGRTELKFKSLF